VVSALAPARVALLGHPGGGGLLSDPVGGYGGRTLALAVPRFFAEVTVEAADHLEILPLAADEPRWSGLPELIGQVDERGYGGPVQLLTATLRTLADLMASVDSPGAEHLRCRIRYHSTIPAGVGLAESSALVVAALSALTESVGLDVPPQVLATVAHRIETQQLGRIAELDDAVVQTYGGLMALDFGLETVDGLFGVGHGDYAPLPGTGLPDLYLAYRGRPAEPSEVDDGADDSDETVEDLFLRLRRSGEPGHGQTREVLRQLAALAIEGEAALRWRHRDRFGDLLHHDLRLRRLLCPLTATQELLLGAAADCQSSATVASSLAGPLVGASVVGMVGSDEHRSELAEAFEAVGAEFVPIGAPPDPGDHGASVGTGRRSTGDGSVDGEIDDGVDDDPDTVVPFDPLKRPDPDGAA
jgi:hypothetical protein